jgi:acyl-CoA synthetase (NDP forming)
MPVSDLDELIDLALPFAYSSPPEGRRVGVFTFGGGRGVLSTDACESAGLVVPPLPAEVVRELKSFTPQAGTSVLNPVDSTVVVALNLGLFSRTVELMADSGVVDSLIVHLFAEFLYPEVPGLLESHVEAASEVARAYGKPLAIVLSTTGDRDNADMVFAAHQAAFRAGVPVYPTAGRAARSLGRFTAYHEGRKGFPRASDTPATRL